MAVKEVLKKDLKREYNIIVKNKEFEEKYQEKITDVSKKISVPGFRKGKPVPVNIVEKKHGEDIRKETIDSLVADSLRKVVNDNNIKLAYEPNIEFKNDKEGEDLEFNFIFEIFPEIPEYKISDISVDLIKFKASDEEIEKNINLLADSQREYKTVEREAKLTDRVILDYKGFLGKEQFRGGTAEKQQLILGSKSFIDNFEDQLVGTKANDEKKVKVTFPKDYFNKELAGKKVEFEVKIHEVQEPQELKIDDEFAKNLGTENLKNLKDLIAQNIEQKHSKDCKFVNRKNIYDALDKEFKFDLPEKILTQEEEIVKNQLLQEKIKKAEDKKSDKELKLTKSEEKKAQELAIRRTRLGFVIKDLSAKESIEATNEDLQRSVSEFLQTVPEDNRENVINMLKNNQEFINSVRNTVVEDKVIDFIIENSKAKFTECDHDKLHELIKEIEDKD